VIPNPTPQLIDMGYDHSRMLFYKDTGEVSSEVWDVLLYQILQSDPENQQALYQAHVSGDFETKQTIHEIYFAQTYATMQNHVNNFIQQLDELSIKAAGSDLKVHPRIPIILRHNEFIKNTFLAVQARLQGYSSW